PPPPGATGPNAAGPTRPPGSGPRRPAGRPDLGDLQNRAAGFRRDLLGGVGGSGGSGGAGGEMTPRRMAPVVAGGLVALYFASGLIVVGAKEEAVVTTFGAWTRSYGPGLGYHFPLFERAIKVGTTDQRETRIDGSVDGSKGPANNTLMLTGDENIVDLSFTVQWYVKDAAAFTFNVEDPEATVKAVAESAMREVVGRNAIIPIIGRDRGKVQLEVAALIQRILDGYQAGIVIDGVQISEAGPPTEVNDAFRDVNNASQNAESYANQARGTAATIIQQAKGYQAQVVREAAGEAARFNQVYEQYRLAPGVTRDRLYIETMQRVLEGSNKVIIDGKGVTAPIVLSPDTFKPRVQTPTGAAQPQVRQPGAAQ
ncbi:MAG: FtsH protease activity modulator HflK, partial [Caulobacterales bacterium]|nr:FtsH protease activity modulator HflK [Caulobacterales bacterium]